MMNRHALCDMKIAALTEERDLWERKAEDKRFDQTNEINTLTRKLIAAEACIETLKKATGYTTDGDDGKPCDCTTCVAFAAFDAANKPAAGEGEK